MAMTRLTGTQVRAMDPYSTHKRRAFAQAVAG